MNENQRQQMKQRRAQAIRLQAKTLEKKLEKSLEAGEEPDREIMEELARICSEMEKDLGFNKK